LSGTSPLYTRILLKNGKEYILKTDEDDIDKLKNDMIKVFLASTIVTITPDSSNENVLIIRPDQILSIYITRNVETRTDKGKPQNSIFEDCILTES
jgi:hypothetical protein